MADRYWHLAPRKPRDCFKADGTPKVRYSEPMAEQKAAEHEGYHAYECPHCGWWHCGSDRPAGDWEASRREDGGH